MGQMMPNSARRNNGNANAMIKPISRDSIEHYFNEFL